MITCMCVWRGLEGGGGGVRVEDDGEMMKGCVGG